MMPNPNPKPIPADKRGHRPRLSPGEETISRGLSLPQSQWRKLDRLARILSQQEGRSVTAQSLIRQRIEGNPGPSEGLVPVSLLNELDNATKKVRAAIDRAGAAR